MRTTLLLLLVFAVVAGGCSIEQGVEGYQPIDSNSAAQGKASLQEFKRKNVKVEDIKVAEGGVAAYGRRVKANIHVRFADGTTMYEGPYQYDIGFFNAPFPRTTVSSVEHGIWLGLNGMGIGGKRRITLEPNSPENQNAQQATLTDTCIPVFLRGIPIMLWGSSGHLIRQEIWCKTQNEPVFSKYNPPEYIY
jgi:hypothetical protein